MQAVAYFSKADRQPTEDVIIHELETMTVVLALRHFRVYVLGIYFRVIMDCNALRATFAKRDLLPRIGRWRSEVQEYMFEIEYRARSRMVHVDALNLVPIGLEV